MKKNCFIAILCVLFIFAGCKGKKEETKVAAPTEEIKEKVYVNYEIDSPSGYVAADEKPESLVVTFESSAAKLSDVDKEPGTAITIKPAISGKWKWESDSILVFKPNENWKLSTKYTVEFPAEIFSDIVKVDNDFSFQTESFRAHIANTEFYINPEDSNEKRVTCEISSNFPMLKDSLEKAVSMKVNYKDEKGKNVEEKLWTYKTTWNKEGTKAYLVSDIIPIPNYTSYMLIEISKDLEAEVGGKVKEKDVEEVEIPGIRDYVSIRRVSTNLVKKEDLNYDQVIVIGLGYC